jgi:site-specific DNA recombinase
MVERVKKGYWMGGGRVPYGYYYDRNDGILHPKEDEAENVRKAFQMYADGYSCDSISRILGFKGERIVIQILKRKSNIGLIEYKGEVYKGLHEPIVDEELFYRVQACIAKRHNNAYVSNTNMLTGLCFCGVCGARMRYQKWKGYGGKSYHRLVCYSTYKSGKDYMRRADSCNNVRPVAKDIEEQVDNAINRFTYEFSSSEKAKHESKKDLIQAQIDKTNIKIKKFYTLYADNESENLLELAMEEEQKLETLKKELRAESEREASAQSKDLNDVRKYLLSWEKLTDKQKNKVLKDCVDKVVITGEKVDIYFTTL